MAGTSRSVAVAAWHLILENACALNDSGRIEVSPLRIAAALCEPLAAIEMLHSSFAALGLIAGSHVVAWKRRQYESDSSTERSRRHRARKKAETAKTLPSATDATLRDVAATDQRQRQRQKEPEANASGRDAPPRLSASDMTRALFETGVQILTAGGHSDRQARSIVGRWRKDHRDSVVLAALSRCQVEQPSDPVGWMTKALAIESGRNGRTPTSSEIDGNGRVMGRSEQAARAAAARAAAPSAQAASRGGSDRTLGDLPDALRAGRDDDRGPDRVAGGRGW